MRARVGFGRCGAYARFLGGVGPFLRCTPSVDDATEVIRGRLKDRAGAFCAVVKRGVFGNPRSPYLALFKSVGCEYGDIESQVRREGLEAFLATARAAGVWVSLDEFKGRRTVERGSMRLEVNSSDFDNPFLASGYQAKSGGTTGQASRTQLDLDFLAGRAHYDAIMFEMLGISGFPVAIWYPALQASTGINNSLRYSRLGNAPEMWFQTLPNSHVRPGIESRAVMAGILFISRVFGRAIAKPVPTSSNDLDSVLDWLVAAKRRAGRCMLQSYVSQAVRVSRRAVDRGLDLDGVVFVVGSEPLTDARNREIRTSGATVYPRYFATEIGSVAMACGDSADHEDYHLLSDSVAAVQEQAGAAFCFTSLLASGPKIMINVQLGDSGRIVERQCNCAFGGLGFKTHLCEVRSFDAVTSEGMTMSMLELARLAEEVLPLTVGGSSVDFQWIEEEDETGVSRLVLVADPCLGAFDEEGVIEKVLESLEQGYRGHRLVAAAWRQAGTLSVRREKPRNTAMGKQPQVLLERKDASLPRHSAKARNSKYGEMRN